LSFSLLLLVVISHRFFTHVGGMVAKFVLVRNRLLDSAWVQPTCGLAPQSCRNSATLLYKSISAGRGLAFLASFGGASPSRIAGDQ
jgi:hypothetical protein